MIGVIAKFEDREIVEEFFQFFKTPWEYYEFGRRYDVMLAAGENLPKTDADLVLIFGGQRLTSDRYQTSNTGSHQKQIFALWQDARIPLYGDTVEFLDAGGKAVICSESGQVLGYEARKGSQRILRLGYNLFQEIKFLLENGQPVENALMPTLDLHIALLRGWILESGNDLVEIPPVPAGYKFITCLTHDVDFIGIRRHFLDHSMFGFLYRAAFKSLLEFLRNEASIVKVRDNLKAVLMLPLVFLGLSRDPWDQFDRYLELEGGAPSTFFFIPYKNYSGEGFDEKLDKYRATRYDVDDVRGVITKLRNQGCEAGVHGLDAWQNVERGKKELDRLRSATWKGGIGIRMHWLCQNGSTFRKLDQAGYSYDSSFGYNETVGFRAGTSQVFKPIDANHLLELPMHIQDTALFNSARMNLSNDRAAQLCNQIIEIFDRNPGVLTLLWHQRSLGPERLWGDFYQMLIRKLHSKNTWFATASDVVEWFRIRRSARFMRNGEVDIPNRAKEKNNLPGLILRKYSCENHVPKKDLAAEPHFRRFDHLFTDEKI